MCSYTLSVRCWNTSQRKGRELQSQRRRYNGSIQCIAKQLVSHEIQTISYRTQEGGTLRPHLSLYPPLLNCLYSAQVTRWVCTWSSASVMSTCQSSWLLTAGRCASIIRVSNSIPNKVPRVPSMSFKLLHVTPR